MDLKNRIIASASMMNAASSVLRRAEVTDEEALSFSALYPEWKADCHYEIGEVVRYSDFLWRCVTTHDSLEGWEPSSNTASLWSQISFTEDGTEEWIQPTGAHNAYSKGDIVSHLGKKWESLVDGNVWEPGISGSESLWKEVT